MLRQSVVLVALCVGTTSASAFETKAPLKVTPLLTTTKTWEGAPIVYRFLPGDDADHCIFETQAFLPFAGERPPSGRTVVVNPEESLESVPELGGLGQILQQDIDNLESIQRGLKANITNKVTLAEYQEVRIRHYHQTLDGYLYGS